MGQTQSAIVPDDQTNATTSTATSVEKSSQPLLDSLIAEAAAYGSEDASESLEAQAQKALQCPCITHLRSGPCGVQFSDAFVCFLKSTTEEKGSDCVNPFVALQNCIKTNPGAFSSDVVEDNESKQEEKAAPYQYTIQPPLWSQEAKPPKQ